MADSEQHAHVPAGTVLLPAPTAWPLVLALGLALSFAGLVTNYSISALGIVFAIAGIIGWARQVFPVEHHEAIVVVPHAMVSRAPYRPAPRQLSCSRSNAP